VLSQCSSPVKRKPTQSILNLNCHFLLTKLIAKKYIFNIHRILRWCHEPQSHPPPLSLSLSLWVNSSPSSLSLSRCELIQIDKFWDEYLALRVEDRCTGRALISLRGFRDMLSILTLDLRCSLSPSVSMEEALGWALRGVSSRALSCQRTNVVSGMPWRANRIAFDNQASLLWARASLRPGSPYRGVLRFSNVVYRVIPPTFGTRQVPCWFNISPI
jgi:hypothetical protein